jgi:hypothetical protein
MTELVLFVYKCFIFVANTGEISCKFFTTTYTPNVKMEAKYLQHGHFFVVSQLFYSKYVNLHILIMQFETWTMLRLNLESTLKI